MPKLKIYENQVAPVQETITSPVVSADQFGASEGRAVQQLGGAITETAGMLDTLNEQQNLSDVQTKVAEKQAALNQELDELIRTVDPADRELEFEEFKERADDELSSVEEDINSRSGRRYYNVSKPSIQGQIVKKAEMGEAELAGEHAANNWTKSTNARQNIVFSDPRREIYEQQVDLTQTAVDGMVAAGEITPTIGEKMMVEEKARLSVSALKGWIKMSPEIAQKELDSGYYPISGQQRATLDGQIDRALRAQELEGDRASRAVERARKARSEADKRDFLLSWRDTDPNNNKSALDIVENDNFSSEDQIKMLRILDGLNKASDKSNPASLIKLYERLYLPTGDPNRLVDESDIILALKNRELSVPDFNKLMDEFQTGNEAFKVQKKTHLNAIKTQLKASNALTGFRNPQGDANYSAYLAFFQEEMARRRKENKIRPEDSLDPSHKDYIGRYAETYIPDQAEALQLEIETSAGMRLPPIKRIPRIAPEATATPSAEDTAADENVDSPVEKVSPYREDGSLKPPDEFLAEVEANKLKKAKKKTKKKATKKRKKKVSN